MISTSDEFKEAEDSDSARYAALINLVLGNYASPSYGTTVTSSGDDASGNYPAAGIINGDHTEINIGAASGADNGIGKASWKSDVAPDGSGNVYIDFQFTAGTRINRIKLYNYSGDPLTSYEFQINYLGPGGANSVVVAGSPDRFTPTGGGFGTGGFGLGPFGGAGVGYTGGLDVYDFSTWYMANSTYKLRLVVYGTTSAGPAHVVAVEVFRTIDITSRVIGYNVDRTRDLKLVNPLAATASLTCDNTDQFFSLEYSPTVYQTNTLGFVNTEWKDLGIDIEINEGFYTRYGLQIIRTFTGNIDNITTRSRAAQATINARDYTKFLIDQTDSCKLKTSIDVTDALRYVLNRNNISDYEMNLTDTGIPLDYFFTSESVMLTTIQQLVQAAGDALFYFDEAGEATFKFFLSSVHNAFTLSGESYWQTGNNTNLDTSTVARRWFLIDNFADGEYDVNPKWYPDIVGSGTFAVESNYLKLTAAGPGSIVSGCCSVAKNSGTWKWRGWVDYAHEFSVGFKFYAYSFPYSISAGYSIEFSSTTGHAYFYRQTAVLADLGPVSNRAWHDWMVTKSGDTFTIYVDGLSVGTITDGTYPYSYLFYVFCRHDCELRITDIYSANVQDAATLADTPTNVKARFESATIDQGSQVMAESTITATYTEPTGTSVTFYTRTSSDDITYSAWEAVAPGSVIPSPTNRYLQVAYDLNCPQDDGLHNTDFLTPTVNNITVSWYFGNGEKKWSQAVDFHMRDDSDIIDLEEQVTDNLGGDSAVINDVLVTAAPMILSGTNTDDQWQGTTGTPADKISAANPLIVTVGDTVLYPTIDNGMDITNMTGTNPSAVAITWGTATGSVAITYIHPTKPVLTITATNPGTITDLRLIGKAFANLTTPYQAKASDTTSIQRRRKRNSVSISNDYIVNSSIAQLIADQLVSNSKNPIIQVPSVEIWPKLTLQPGDQINVYEQVSGANTNYYATGYNRSVNVSNESADVSMSIGLIKI